VPEDIRMIFNAPERETAEIYLRKAVEKFADLASRLADWMMSTCQKGVQCLHFRKRIKINYKHPISLNGSVRKSNAGLILCGCSTMTSRACAEYQLFRWRWARIGNMAGFIWL